MNKFIVGEVSKTWTVTTPATDLISMKFESVINVNHERGYKLVDWRLITTSNDNALIETIIAVFERKDQE